LREEYNVEAQESVERIIIPFAEASELVARASQIYVKECVCRVRVRACARDVDVCLHFAGAPAEDLEGARSITTEEAQAILRRTAEWAAIFQVFYYPSNRRVTELCSCCGCCCSPLRGMKETGSYNEQRRTGYLAVTDEALCVACGQCQEACLFEARTVEGDRLRLAEERCFGCGVCVGRCPEGAIRVELIPGRGESVSVEV
jgi:electron transport complex protein RnfB